MAPSSSPRFEAVLELIKQAFVPLDEVIDQLERHIQKDPQVIKGKTKLWCPEWKDEEVYGSLLHFILEREDPRSIALAKWFLSKGLSVDEKDSEGRTALEMLLHRVRAIVDDRSWRARDRLGKVHDLIRFLLEAGADVDLENPKTAVTPYEYALKRLSTRDLPRDLLKKYRHPPGANRRIHKVNGEAKDASSMTDVSGLLQSGMYSDVILMVGDRSNNDKVKPFKAHRDILAQRSTYFKSMFQGPMRMVEADADTVVIADVDSGTFEVILKAMYRGKLEEKIILEHDDVDAMSLLDATIRFGTSFSVDSLLGTIEDSLTISNVLGVLHRAKTCHCEPLVSVCRSFIISHHCLIVQQPGADFDKDDLEELFLALKHAGPYRLWPAGVFNGNKAGQR